jgi:hypothetical protein
MEVSTDHTIRVTRCKDDNERRARIAQTKKRFYHRNKDKFKDYNKAYYQKNKERLKKKRELEKKTKDLAE